MNTLPCEPLPLEPPPRVKTPAVVLLKAPTLFKPQKLRASSSTRRVSRSSSSASCCSTASTVKSYCDDTDRSTVSDAEDEEDATDNSSFVSSKSSSDSFKSTSSKRDSSKRKVSFQESPPDIMAYKHDLMSYDELVFRVAGFDDIMRELREKDEYEEYGEMPKQLVVGEFLYRSALVLGYQPPDSADSSPPELYFHQFSAEDVMRWRRLAHHNWQQEDVTIGRNSLGKSAKLAVKDWFRGFNPKSTKPIPVNKDLSHLVTVVNSCILFGTFHFHRLSIWRLCNVKV